MTTKTLDSLSWTVAEFGVDADLPGVRAFAQAAQRRALSPVLIEVLMDAGSPAPVRQRAFGRLAARYALGA